MILYENQFKLKPVPYGVKCSASGRVYTTPEYKEFKDKLRNFVLRDFSEIVFPPTYNVKIIFYLATKNYTSKNAGDLDNLSKGVLDSLQGVIWTNDAQITRLEVIKYPALEYGIYLLVKGFH